MFAFGFSDLENTRSSCSIALLPSTHPFPVFVRMEEMLLVLRVCLSFVHFERDSFSPPLLLLLFPRCKSGRFVSIYSVLFSFATSCGEYSRMVLVCLYISSLPPLEKISAFYQEGKLCKLFLLHPKLRTKNLVPNHFRIRIECGSLFPFETFLTLQQSFYIFFSRIVLLLAFFF